MIQRLRAITILVVTLLFLPPVALAADNTFNKNEIGEAAVGFFGAMTEGLASVIEKVFSELGQPNAYIIGQEGSGAIIVGATYGKGDLVRKGYEPVQVFWQGPSIGFDIGGNASRVMTLVYNLPSVDDLYRRFPAVDGSLYYIGGAGVNYQRNEGITLAPVRIGVGLRAGINIGMMHFTRTRRILPF